MEPDRGVDAGASLSASYHGGDFAGTLEGCTCFRRAARLFKVNLKKKKKKVMFEGRLPRRQGVKLHKCEETAIDLARLLPCKYKGNSFSLEVGKKTCPG